MNVHIEMEQYYNEYLKSVSKNAASMKCCSLLLNLSNPGSKILDLGSGFSSFVLRYYQQALDLQVWSVDTDATWLLKTRNFCVSHGVCIDNFYLWKEIIREPKPFNLIFCDIGVTKDRVGYIAKVLENFVDDKTFVLFDDMHKSIIRHGLEKILTGYNYKEIGVKETSLDEYGRYSRLIYAIRKK